MLVKFGNASVLGAGGQVMDRLDPTVTTMQIPDDYSFDPNVDIDEYKAHLYDAVIAGGGITQRENDEALLAVTHANGAWNSHSNSRPLWVDSDNAEFAALLGKFYGCPVGEPADVEDTHFTVNGPPGVNVSGPTALLVNSGRDIWALMQAGGLQAGLSGTATATGATSLTNSGAPFTGTTTYNGQVIITPTAYGVIQSNSTTVINIDRWYSFATPGGAAASTPGGTTTYVIGTFMPSALFMGLTANASAASSSDTSLTAEITTGGGGLVRKICPYAHSAGTNTYTMTPVYTANGSDTLPVTIAKMGLFTSMVVASTTLTMMFETLLSATATLSASGDQLTITETVTGS